MRAASLTLVAGLVLATFSLAEVAAKAAHGHGAGGVTKGVANAVLAATGRATPVKLIDYDQDRCDPRTVDAWLRAIGGTNIRAITWSGGPCELVGPGIDSGGDWCAQATVTLAHPKDRHDSPQVEVYFEKPVHGRPGVAYAFRGAMQAADGWDISRFRKDFEADWASRFPITSGVRDCPEGAE